ncbi:MAG: hypothetical protein SOZ56_09925 [Oscillospiraceae bacterium]|nr:hypothetical protein [Oscillospiraceae bacterium]
MAKHEFGIMETAPKKEKRYDKYEPQKYNCIAVDDVHLENIVTSFDDIDFFWHTPDVPGKGIAYCGITLIPPSSMEAFISVIENISELSELKALLQKTYSENKWVIHFGI